MLSFIGSTVGIKLNKDHAKFVVRNNDFDCNITKGENSWEDLNLFFGIKVVEPFSTSFGLKYISLFNNFADGE